MPTYALCSTPAAGVFGVDFGGTPFVPTGSERHGAQGGSKASPLGDGTEDFSFFAKNTGATF
jgi:hypothetical protein